MRRVLMVVALLALANVAGWGISIDPGITYNLSTGTVQTGIDTVGIPFYVSQTIYVTALGAYDYDFNGISEATSINVSINPWSGPFPSLTLGPSIVSTTLTNASAAVSGTGAVWNYFSNGVAILPGWYMVVASGFDTANPTIGGLSVSGADVTLNTFNNIVSYGAAFTLPGPVNYYGTAVGSGGTLNAWLIATSPVSVAGGTFGVPEPSAYLLMSTVGIGLYLLRRRKVGANK